MSIDQYLRKVSYTSLFINTSHNEQLELKSMESLWRMKVDGIILLATNVTKQHIALVEKLDVPVLFVGQQFDQGISIIYDDERAGKFIGSYAGRLSFQHPYYIGVEESDVAVGVVRRNGVFTGFQETSHKELQEIFSDFSYETTRDKVNELLDHHKVDLLICATDRQAMAAYQVIQERGLQIPEDISIIGFGGYEVSSILRPKLTTVKFDADTAGYLAGETMLKMIQGEPVSKTQIVDYSFLEGESVKQAS